ncbi:MAG: lipase [Actinomycetota bacterium]|nr:lipase [Actinomycetota bacterium]
MFRASSPRRLVFLAGAAGLAALIVLVVVLTASSGSPPAAAVPVVVVPGYGGDASSLQPLTNFLRRQGRIVEPVTLPLNGTGDVDRSARALADVISGLNGSTVDLVGFSAGGIVVRHYVKAFGGAQSARRVVLLGTPNHGTELAELATSFDPSACEGACAQLGPRSSFLRDLNSGDETPAGPSYYSLWTAFDLTVTPPRSAELEGAINIRVQDICRNARTAHGELVTDPIALRLVEDALQGEPRVANADRGPLPTFSCG